MRQMNLKEYISIISSADYILNFSDFDAASAFTHLLGAMYFPESEEKRRLWCSKVHILQKSREIEKKSVNQTDFPGYDQYAAIGNIISEIAKIHESQEKLISSLLLQQGNSPLSEVAPRFTTGRIIGHIFQTALKEKSAFEPIIASVCNEISKLEFEETDKEAKQKNAYFKNTLMKQFLPVAHFWAAYNDYEMLGYLNFGDNVFSVDDIFKNKNFESLGKQDGFIGFLKYAEGYLMRGIGTYPIRSGARKPLLDIKKMIVALLPAEYV